MHFFGNLAGDVRYALRTFRLSPGFTAAAVVAIAVGVGINTGLFSVLNGLALRDMPAPAAHELVTVHQVFEGGTSRQVHGTHTMFSAAEYQRYRDSKTLQGIMGYSLPEPATLGGDQPREINGSLVTCNYFDVLQRQPVLGRSFADGACETPGSSQEVVLGHDLWLSAFAADPTIVGRTVMLNRNAFTVAGVAPEGFAGVEFMKASFFVPIAAQKLLTPYRDYFGDPYTSWLTLVGRRAPGANLDRVRVELGVIAGQIDQQDPGRRTSLVIDRASPLSFPEIRPVAFGVAGVVMTGFGLVLLIACANVANLLLARAAARSREIALRLSLGATRRRLVQQLMTESVLIAAAGGLLGSLLAFWSFQGIVAFVLSSLPAAVPVLQIDPQPDFTVFAYAVAITFATGIVFGLVPALHASNPQLYATLKHDSAAAGTGRRRGRLRGILVGAQVAMCLVLTISASLLLRGLYAAQTVEPGFEYHDVAVASFDLRGSGYDPERATLFNRQLAARLAAVPGVSEVAQVGDTPLSPGRSAFELRLPGEDEPFSIQVNNASPGYFSLVGLPVIRGREFSVADLADTSTSIMVTEATARRLWPGQEPLGKTFLLDIPSGERITLEVIGVVKDAYIKTIGKIDDDYVYLPAAPRVQAEMQTLVKTRGDLSATMIAMRETARALDPALVARVTPLEDNLEFWRTWSGLVASLSGALGALSLVLASIGVYALVSYSVNLRIRELGIRIALGASAGQVLALVLKQNGRPVMIGAAIGVLACTLVARLIAGLLFGVSTLDPAAVGGATAVVLGFAVVAAVVPARRAMRVDPMNTLRYE